MKRSPEDNCSNKNENVMKVKDSYCSSTRESSLPVLSPGATGNVGAGPSLDQDPQTHGGLCCGSCMDWTSAPGVTAVDVLQLLSIEKIFQKLCIVPECSLVKQPSRKILNVNERFHNFLGNLSTVFVATYCQFLLLKKVSHFN